MLTVDTHCHVLDTWFEPVEVLLFQMARADVDKAVLVQLSTNYDNSYLVECSDRFPGRFAIVGAVDTSAPDCLEKLEYWAGLGVIGVRLTPMQKSAGKDPLAVWKKANTLGMLVDLWALHGPDAMKGFVSDEYTGLVERFPQMPFIIEHLGFVANDPDPPYADFKRILALNRYANVFLKLPGFGEFVPRPVPHRSPPYDFDAIPPFIDMALDAFGPDRVMVGSDHPRCSDWEGYSNVFGYLREYLGRLLNADEMAAVLGATAERIYFANHME